MNQYCLNLLKHTKYIIIQRLAGNTETKSSGAILVIFFATGTIIAQPLEDSVSEDIKRAKMQYRNTILKKVKNYIDNEFNPSKKNFLDKANADYVELKSIEEILSLLEISPKDYQEALSISDDSGFQIYYKRTPNSCFVNNYFYDGLMAYQANMSMQQVFNHYKAVAYMCAYLS